MVTKAAVVVLEDSPLFNAGPGAVLTTEETAEHDAAVMCGRRRAAGAVDGVVAVGCGPPPPITPPTAPNGEWIGQNPVGSVPGMNDSM